MRIGRWSELSVDMVCQQHEVMKGANQTSGELCSALEVLIESSIRTMTDGAC